MLYPRNKNRMLDKKEHSEGNIITIYGKLKIQAEKNFQEKYWKVKLLEDKILEGTVHKVGQARQTGENEERKSF